MYEAGATRSCTVAESRVPLAGISRDVARTHRGGTGGTCRAGSGGPERKSCVVRLAIIPARGGSRRIPGKNIKPFAGKPMIAWSIEAAFASELFDRVIVSTDDERIAATAREHGAQTPFLRPAGLSGDRTATVPVVAHAIEWLAAHGTRAEEVCCIYATAPFIRVDDLRDAAARLRDTGADYAFPITSFAFPVQRGVAVTPEGRLRMFQPEHALTRSQDLEEAYHDAGQFYWGLADAWSRGTPLMGPASAPVVIPRYRVQDIDTPEDWARAETMFEVLRVHGTGT